MTQICETTETTRTPKTPPDQDLSALLDRWRTQEGRRTPLRKRKALAQHTLKQIAARWPDEQVPPRYQPDLKAMRLVTLSTPTRPEIYAAVQPGEACELPQICARLREMLGQPDWWPELVARRVEKELGRMSKGAGNTVVRLDSGKEARLCGIPPHKGGLWCTPGDARSLRTQGAFGRVQELFLELLPAAGSMDDKLHAAARQLKLPGTYGRGGRPRGW